MSNLQAQPALRYLRAFAALAVALGCAHAFYDIAERYEGYELRQSGVHSVPKSEVLFSAWYLLFGSLALGFLAYSLAQTNLPRRLLARLRSVLRAPTRLAAACALLVACGALLFRWLVLRDQPITDDELTYDFIAATLRTGHVVNAPPIAAEFLRNQFVIANAHAWYGKYPIGHPLLLALAQLLHVQGLLVPLVGAAGVALTFQIGRRLLGERWAALGCVLLALSPQYVWTHGTRLSQPTSMLCLLLALWCWLRLLESDQPRFAALAGLALGFGILARPFPSALFALAALPVYALQRLRGPHPSRPARRVLELALAGSGVAAGAGLVLLVNCVQSGSPWTSGYQVVHGSTDLLDSGHGIIAASVGAALLREGFWLHGWPLSLLFVPFARFRQHAALVWGLIAAAIAYRLLVPKAVLATTGPIYMLEVVPLLCLASAAGIAHVSELLGRALAAPERARELLLSAVLAACAAALVLFAPVQLRAAYRAGTARLEAQRTLRAAGVERAVVFSNAFVMREAGVSWALFPPNPSPKLDDPLVFLRILPGEAGRQRMLQLARTRFKGRRCVLLVLSPEGLAVRELTARIDGSPRAQLSRSDPR